MNREFVEKLIQPYGNKSGRSGVKGYAKIGDDPGDYVFLVVFRDNTAYAYAPGFAGKYAIEEMHKLAREGEGLASYIAKERPLGMRIELVYTTENPK